MSIRKARNLVREGARNVLTSALKAMWTVEGETGIWQYVGGCKKNHTPAEGEVIAAINDDSTAIFKRDEVVMQIMSDALNGTSEG